MVYAYNEIVCSTEKGVILAIPNSMAESWKENVKKTSPKR